MPDSKTQRTGGHREDGVRVADPCGQLGTAFFTGRRARTSSAPVALARTTNSAVCNDKQK